jgi:5'-3' exonuclease
MGVPKLFQIINKGDITYSSIIENLDKQINAEYFYMDFNSIIHVQFPLLVTDINLLLMSIITNKINNDILKKYKLNIKTIDEFKNHFTTSNIEEMLISIICKYIHNLIKTFFKSKLNLLYIAIDGVPSKSKLIEQIQRKYIGALMTGYKDQLYENYKDDIEKDKNRFLFEETKISFNRSKITPGTEFMNNLYLSLKKEQFNATNIYISGVTEVGEGEKKIVDHIKNNKYNNVCIYSPDADMMLLASLLNSTNVTILRYNQQTSSANSPIYDLIDIDMFKNNIYDYINDKNINKKNFIDDVICLSSMFGNDFIPKIESIDVQYNFGQVLNIYMDTFRFFENKNYLVNLKNKYSLNINFFIKFLELYWDVELFNMKENYMLLTYRMYRSFKTSLDINHTNYKDKIIEFEENVKKLDDYIKRHDIENIIIKYEDDIIIKKIRKLVNYGRFEGIVPNKYKTYKEIGNYVDSLNKMEFIKLYIKVVKKKGSIVKKYNDSVYSASSKTAMHQNNLRNTIKYDKEVYLFNNMLDNYAKILRNKPIVLVNNTDPPEKTISEYYKLFFDIDDYQFIQSKHELTNNNEKLDNVIYNYLEGLVWTFEYYYNESSNVSTWYYKEEKAPILRDIYLFINKNKNIFDIINKNLEKYKITNIKNFFNPVEQLMYVLPYNKYNKEIIPIEYIDFFETNKHYIDIDKILNNMTSEINCIGARYLNKCIIKSVEKHNPKYDMEFIKQLRDIKLEKETLQKIGLEKGYKTLISYVKYKQKYKETNLIKYKNKYKIYKNKLEFCSIQK